MTYRHFDEKVAGGAAHARRQHGDGPAERAETFEARAERHPARSADLLPVRKDR